MNYLLLLDENVAKYEIILQSNHKIMVVMAIGLVVLAATLIYLLCKYEKLQKKQANNNKDIYD